MKVDSSRLWTSLKEKGIKNKTDLIQMAGISDAGKVTAEITKLHAVNRFLRRELIFLINRHICYQNKTLI